MTKTRNGEPVATLEMEYGELHGISLGAKDVPAIIDELPVLARGSSQARGVTEVGRGAVQLRVKETDRIATIVDELVKSEKIEALPDGFVIEGPVKLKGAEVNSHGDHRLAMSLAVAGLAARGRTLCTTQSAPTTASRV